MPTRYLKESICTSESLARLSAEGERFWYRLLVQCDDFGRMDARPVILRAACFPLALDQISTENVERWLAELVEAACLHVYRVEGKPYLEIIAFTKHNTPRAKVSKFPPPPTLAGTCMQPPASADKRLQIPSYSESESNIGIGIEVGRDARATPAVAAESPPPPAPLPERIVIDLTNEPPSLLSLYRDASGEMGQITPVFRTWFNQITSRYTRPQCEAVFRQLSADIVAGKTNGSKWTHTVALFEALNASAKPEKSNGHNGLAAAKRSDYNPGTAEELAEARRVMDEHRAKLKELEAA